MSKRLAFPDDRLPPSGGGPEDPMLEQRLGRLEQILGRLEPMIVDLARTAVRQADLAAFRSEMRTEMATKADLASFRTETKAEFALVRSEMATKENVAAVHNEVAELKGRVKGVEDRFVYFPTTTQMMAIIATMLIGLTGIIFVAGRYFKP